MLRSTMPAFSTKTAVIRACTRVHHPLTKVVTIWRTRQRRHRSRCGLTRRHWKPMNAITWMWLPQLSSIRKQRSFQMFKSSPQEVPDNSEFITSVDTRKVQSEFAVRNVTELVLDDGQQADESRKTRLNEVDGLVRGLKSAGRIERLLRNKRRV